MFFMIDNSMDKSMKTQKLQLKVRTLLDGFGAKNTLAGFVLFPVEKIGFKERKALRRKLFEQINQHILKSELAFSTKPTLREKKQTDTQVRQLKSWALFDNMSLSPEKNQRNVCKTAQDLKNKKDFRFFMPGEGRPEHPLASVSLSHTGALGAFVFTLDKNRSIGLDIEQTKRVTHKILTRVANQNEIQQAPLPALLWTAKEAGLKSLNRKRQKLFLKDCVVLSWKKLKHLKQAFVFECLCKKTGRKAFGTAQHTRKWTMAYAEKKANH